jgi:hypothetical protein
VIRILVYGQYYGVRIILSHIRGVYIDKINIIRVRIYYLDTGPYYTAIYYSEHCIYLSPVFR